MVRNLLKLVFSLLFAISARPGLEERLVRNRQQLSVFIKRLSLDLIIFFFPLGEKYCNSFNEYLGRRNHNLNERCYGFGWVNFLHRGLNKAAFWIFDENGGDSTPMF